jgi:dTDP-4-amino-4,6-dideoxygalactose transaminase
LDGLRIKGPDGMAEVGFREWIALGRAIAAGRLARYDGEGPGEVDRFEARLAKTIGVKHVLTVNSGTNALVAALAAAGIGPGDEVLVPAYTWIATAAAVVAAGAVPIMVDIDESLTIDPIDIERKITPYTRAIIPVHMLNLVCDMDAIMQIAGRRNLVVIEDACQAVGLRYKGRRIGSIGHAAVFSFNKFKNINIAEGGALLTNDNRLYTRARMHHDVGSYTRNREFEYNEPVFVGLNNKANELQGAMLNVQLAKLDPMLKRRRKWRAAMAAALEGANGFRLCPSHDPAQSVSLNVIFERAEDAEAFSRRRGVRRLSDSGRHIYTNWEPILAQRTVDERMNPFTWARRPIEYSADMCARTLDILARSCAITLGQRYPAPAAGLLSRLLTR